MQNNHSIKPLRCKATLLVALGVSPLAAGLASGAITIATVPVGNPGNVADSIGNGAVSYSFNIGEYDVTASQYTAFLNAVAATDPDSLWNNSMPGTTAGAPGITRSGSSGSYTYAFTPSRASFPVTFVNFYNALRFANWLDNGQPTGAEGNGTTDTGAYTITSLGITNNSITRNPGATWALESQDEWTKAAYYNASGGTYSLFPTQSNTITTSQANYLGSDTTAVGTYAYPSYYGTYDEGGDVFQFNETIESTTDRGDDGGAFNSSSSGPLQNTSTSYVSETFKSSNLGFRVVELSVPEPTSAALLGIGCAASLLGRRRARR